MSITRDALLFTDARARRADRRAERRAERSALRLASTPAAVLGPTRARAAVVDEVRCEQATVARVSLWTVLKVAAIFWAIAAALGLILLSLTISAISAAGVLHDVEKFVADASGLDTFTIDTSALWRAGVALSVLGACIATVATVLAAGLYNLYASIVGGITLELHCRDRALD